ncbi:MAG: hypothetical protein MI919_24775, partial [Holophagales bacterium]|nr:hypothetical protein [Holophagales bacterium]
LRLLEGYPLGMRQELVVELPAGARHIELPEPLRRSEGLLRWSLEWQELPAADTPASSGPGPAERGPTVRILLELDLEKGELDARESRLFRTQLRRLHADLASGALYGIPP